MLVLLVTAVCVASARAGQVYVAAPADRGQYQRTGLAGRYNYGYNTGDGAAKVEVKREDGSVVGSYRYFDPHGVQIVRSYIADSNGFRVLGNGLPVAPALPAAAIRDRPALTAPVEGAGAELGGRSLRPGGDADVIDIKHIGTHQSSLRVHFQQQQKVLQEQKDLIKQQQALLEQLVSSSTTSNVHQEVASNRVAEDDIHPHIQELKHRADIILGRSPTQSGTRGEELPSPNDLTESFLRPQDSSLGESSNLYFYPDRHDYEFPAGFAYHKGQPIREAPSSTTEAPLAPVIGGKQSNVKEPILTAGRGVGRSAPPRPFGVINRGRRYGRVRGSHLAQGRGVARSPPPRPFGVLTRAAPYVLGRT